MTAPIVPFTQQMFCHETCFSSNNKYWRSTEALSFRNRVMMQYNYHHHFYIMSILRCNNVLKQTETPYLKETNSEDKTSNIIYTWQAFKLTWSCKWNYANFVIQEINFLILKTSFWLSINVASLPKMKWGI